MNMYYKVEDVDGLMDLAVNAIECDLRVAKQSNNIEDVLKLLEVSKALLAVKLKVMDLQRYSDGRD